MNITTCSNESDNVLPVNLIMTEMLNESPNLTNFLYDFDPNKYKMKTECPSWMNGCQHGSLKISQILSKEDIINFASIGDLTGYGNNGEVSCYYFPVSLNLYDNNSPDGGEIVIELKDKSPPKGSGSDRILIFIPIIKNKENQKSKKWFQEISTNTSQIENSETKVPFSLNDIIPKASFWVYNDIRLHGTTKSCTNPNEKTHGIFFQFEDAIGISTVDFDIILKKVKTLKDNAYKCVTDAINPEKTTQECEVGMKPESINWPWRLMKPNTDETAIAGAKAGDIVMNSEKMKVRKCCIFKNDIGTKRGPGLHNQIGDPFSLTCEPIIDADDETPIDAKDRLEWVKNIYKSTSPEMKNMFTALIFICILIFVLMSVHVVIFKNIGLFITQNEISERVHK
tara:strand:+ start:546 stop:1736 length:1191 start_codon:yes stop_codon:yes gene_type:complete